MIGVLGARGLDRMVAYAVIGSMGMLMSALSVFTPAGIAAALYYASAFHAGDGRAVPDRRRGARASPGRAEPWFDVAPPLIPGAALVAALFFAAAIAMTGLPPLSGFLGKLLILDAAAAMPRAWVWAVCCQ